MPELKPGVLPDLRGRQGRRSDVQGPRQFLIQELQIRQVVSGTRWLEITAGWVAKKTDGKWVLGNDLPHYMDEISTGTGFVTDHDGTIRISLPKVEYTFYPAGSREEIDVKQLKSHLSAATS